MAFSIKTADADQYRIQIAGISISQGAGQSGYADGEFFTCTQPTESFVIAEGTDGSVSRAKTNSRILEMTVKLMQTCASNDILSALLISDENAPNGAGIGSFVLLDLAGTTLIRCSAAWIRKPADVSLDRSPKERVWPIHGIKDFMNVGSN